MSFHLQLLALFRPQVEQARNSSAEPAADAFRALFHKLADSLRPNPISTESPTVAAPAANSILPGPGSQIDDAAPASDAEDSPFNDIPVRPSDRRIGESTPVQPAPTIAPTPETVAPLTPGTSTVPVAPAPIDAGAPAPVEAATPAPAKTGLPAPVGSEASVSIQPPATANAEPTNSLGNPPARSRVAVAAAGFPTRAAPAETAEPVAPTPDRPPVDRPAQWSAREPIPRTPPIVVAQRAIAPEYTLQREPRLPLQTAASATATRAAKGVPVATPPQPTPDSVVSPLTGESVRPHADVAVTENRGRVLVPPEPAPASYAYGALPETTVAKAERTPGVNRAVPPNSPAEAAPPPEVQATAFQAVSRVRRERASPRGAASIDATRSLPQTDGFEPIAEPQRAVQRDVPAGPRRAAVLQHAEPDDAIPAPRPESERAPATLNDTNARVAQRLAAQGTEAPLDFRHDVEPARLIPEPANAGLPAVDTTLGRAEPPARVDPPLTVPIRAGQLAQTILSQARNLDSNAPVELRFALHPKELGTVQIRIHASGERLHVELVAQTSGASGALNAGVPRLVQQLQAAGYPDAEVTLTLDTSSDSSPHPRHGDRETGNDPRQATRDHAPPIWYEPGGAIDTPERKAYGRLDRMA